MKWVLKPLVSAGFVAFALWEGAWGSTYGRVMLAGFCLSWFGDVFLISEKLFLPGLVSFLFAHIAYAWAFVIRGMDGRWAVAASVVVAVIAIVIARWLTPHVAKSKPQMKIPVLAYMAVISVMVVFSVGAAGASGNFLILAGAVAFFLSDISVARDKFVTPGFVNRAWGLPLYYAAQLILASTVP